LTVFQLFIGEGTRVGGRRTTGTKIDSIRRSEIGKKGRGTGDNRRMILGELERLKLVRREGGRLPSLIQI